MIHTLSLGSNGLYCRFPCGHLSLLWHFNDIAWHGLELEHALPTVLTAKKLERAGRPQERKNRAKKSIRNRYWSRSEILTFARELSIMFAGTFVTAHNTFDILIFLVAL